MLENIEENPVTVEEIKSLRDEISLMHASLAHDMMEHAPLVQKVTNRFIDKGINRHRIEKLLAPLVGSGIEDDEEILVAYVLEELDSLLSVEDEVTNFENEVKIVVGATGIGKTSLIGKLGGRYKYLLKKEHDLAFFNYDKHKVGAIEQLSHYADAMEIPLVSFDSLLENKYDLVLIDTAGSMGENLQELRSLINVLKEDMDYKVHISLVLSATSKQRDLEEVLKVFNDLEIKNFIFTKLDETSDLSDMINFSINEDRPIAYLSVGQEIPEDLMVASKEYILNKFME